MSESIAIQATPILNLKFVMVTKVYKIRENVFSCDGVVVVGGPLYAPGGYLFCLSCEEAECEHCQAVFNAWINKEIVTDESIPFDSSPIPVMETSHDYAV